MGGALTAIEQYLLLLFFSSSLLLFFSLSPLGLAKRCADVRSPERACRCELERVSEAAKCVGASLEGDSPIEHFISDPRRAVNDS